MSYLVILVGKKNSTDWIVSAARLDATLSDRAEWECIETIQHFLLSNPAGELTSVKLLKEAHGELVVIRRFISP